MVIDAGLAKGIRRGYMRHLRDAWHSHQRRTRAARSRNQLVHFDTPKAYRRTIAAWRERLGTLLGVTEFGIETRSRSAWLALSLYPVFDENPLGSADFLECRGSYLLRPGGGGSCTMRVAITAHALDRIIQRAGLVTTPIRVDDVRAVNAEFADALHYALPAFAAVADMPDAEALQTSVLLPSQHGFFLGDYDPTENFLRLRTFIDEAKVRSAQRIALRELRAIDPGHLALLSFAAVAPGWLEGGDAELIPELQEIWRKLRWRLREDPPPPGMSDVAWMGRTSDLAAEVPNARQAGTA